MRQIFLIAIVVLGLALPAFAHPSPKSAVQLRIDRTGIDAEVTMPLDELRMGYDETLSTDPDEAVAESGDAIEKYVLRHVHAIAPDGRSWAVAAVGPAVPVRDQVPDVIVNLRLTPPAGAPVDQLTLDYDVIMHHLVSHAAIVSVRSDWRNGVLGEEPVLLGTIYGTENPDARVPLTIDRTGGSWWQGVASVFRLGLRHIAEGTDHLLFLLALLLPAPLAAAGRRWGGFAGTRTSVKRIVKIVTAFTLGHSATLVIGALGWVHWPTAPIEAAIAFSILVSAVHALVPVARGKEIYIAGGFGLVHGLAFASTLTAFGFDAVTMLSSVLSFNLGIEAMQLFVIAVTMPWLVMLAQTPLYTPLRVGGALVTLVAAATWFAERALGTANPVGPWVEAAASHALWIVGGLAVVATAAWLACRPRATVATA